MVAPALHAAMSHQWSSLADRRATSEAWPGATTHLAYVHNPYIYYIEVNQEAV
ncbi:MAG: hypothetical protein ACOZFS_14375 [Thermodesulfobacteriota bacterium]